MCKKTITLEKFLKLLLEIVFYNVLIYLTFFLMGYESFSIKGVLKAIIPITSISHNFIECYLVFFLLIPYLNVLVNHLNETSHRYLVALLTMVYTIFGTATNSIIFNYISWFAVIYIVASYIRLYPKKIYDNKHLWGGMTVLFIVLSSSSVLVMNYLQHLGLEIDPYYFLVDSNKLLAFVSAISSFLYFRMLKMKNSKIVNVIAGSTFGVLLIHANSDAMRSFLWKSIFDNVNWYQTRYFYLHAIVTVLLVFVVCICIDLGRRWLIEKPVLKIIDRILEKR